MKTSKVLKIAKDWLSTSFTESDGKDKFICIAMQYASAAKKIPTRDFERVRDEVQQRLQGAYTLECWLRGRGLIPEKFLHDHELMQRVQDYRHAWLDSMIAEYKAKGD